MSHGNGPSTHKGQDMPDRSTAVPQRSDFAWSDRISAATFSLPYVAPSLNRSLRQHWAVRRKVQKQLDLIVSALCPKFPRPEASDRCQVTITRIGKRLLDADNLAGSAKQIVDSLKYAKAFVDDSRDHVTLIFEQRKANIGEKPHTEIAIERERSKS